MKYIINRGDNMIDLSNESVIHVKKDNVEYLQFRKLLEYSDTINHAYSLGISRNFRTARAKDKKQLTGNEYEKAINDYKELCEKMGENYNNIVKPNQSHTRNVKIVNSKINISSPDINLEEYNSNDGLITNKKNIILATTNADCILLLFFDPIKKVIANTHSGWKGTLQRISVETVKKMQNEYECKPQDIICCICPSIRKCHFEVKSDVQELFSNEFKDFDNIDEIITKEKDTDKWMIDTVKINQSILEDIGLKKENIIDSKICSVCHSDIIHSYRAEKENYGLNTALIEIKE